MVAFQVSVSTLGTRRSVGREISYRDVKQNNWVRANGFTNGHELRHIESSFPGFELRHKSLTLLDTLAEFRLRYTRVFSRCNQQLDHPAIKIGLE